ncbi:MAG TPA: hypothetical protein DCE41_36110 [Cytophagales bacterium]|nr:hypothetical protein [Cytophagales bacterium]HAA18757.1 hypothetical protein [Cytophagales bacterium]HAP63153.1 hypothetical protein [Cytophagales bacterium]
MSHTPPPPLPVFTFQDWSSWQALLNQSAGMSFEMQQNLGDIIGDQDWQIDLPAARLTFGGQLNFPIQILGSLSFQDHTWMWGWANSQSNIPEPLLTQANTLRELGEKHRIPEMTTGHFEVPEGFEYQAGTIGRGVFQADGYYCANYGTGTLVATIKSDLIPKIDPEAIERVITLFPQLISGLPLDHRAAFLHYATARGLETIEEDTIILATRGIQEVVATFNEQGILQGIEGKLAKS